MSMGVAPETRSERNTLVDVRPRTGQGMALAVVLGLCRYSAAVEDRGEMAVVVLQSVGCRSEGTLGRSGKGMGWLCGSECKAGEKAAHGDSIGHIVEAGQT